MHLFLKKKPGGRGLQNFYQTRSLGLGLKEKSFLKEKSKGILENEGSLNKRFVEHIRNE